MLDEPTPDPAGGVQKRRRLRHAVDVEVVAELVSERARSFDLSAGGMFVDTAHHYVPGLEVRLLFTLDGHRFDTRARVVHVSPQVGFGAEFLDLDRRARVRLLRFVHGGRATREAERLLAQRRAREHGRTA